LSLSAKGAAAVAKVEAATPAPRFLPLGTITVRLVSPPLTDRRLVFGVLSNVSMTGACVIANQSLPVDSRVNLVITSRGLSDKLEIGARVVWCAERLEPVKEIVGYLTGVCFHSHARERVADLLASGLFQTVS
jgi:hypothetical protein